MTTAGPNAAGTGATSGSGVAWVNPGNVTTDNATYAVASVTSGSPDSQELKVTNFGFALGATDIIDGIQFDVNRIRNGSGNCNDLHIYLIKAGTTQTGTDKADATNWSTSSEETKTYGSSSDLWGQTGLVGSDINDSGFGISIAAHRVATNPNASVDYVTCTITYHAAGATTQQQMTMMGIGS